MSKMINHIQNASTLLVFLIIFILITGCQIAIDPGAFNRFADSTAQLREGVDEVLEHQYKWARDRFIEEISLGDSLSEENVQKLLMENVPGKAFAWTTPEPPLLFLEAQKFRETVRELNDALVQYAELLAELAIVGRMDEEEFKATAEGINSGLRDAADTLSESDHNREIAIFSTGATELFQQYLNSKSKEKLREALDRNQETVRIVSDHLRDAMRLASQQAFAEYSPRSLDLAVMLTPDSGLSPEKKKDRVVELIDLNEFLIKRLDTLRRLDDSYRALPGVNRELAASLDKKEGGLASIYRIRDNAKRLREQYKELEKPADDQDADSVTGSNEE